MAFSKPWSLVFVSVAFLLFVFFAASPLLNQSGLVLFSTQHRDDVWNHGKKNIWADLTPEEAKEVVNFVLSDAALNLTETSKASTWDNTIRLVEALQPNKTDALAYLHGSSGPPERWARVVTNQRSLEDAQIVNYMVGPLPPNDSTKIQPLEFCYNADRNYVYEPFPGMAPLLSWSAELASNYSDLFKELLEGEFDPLDPESLGGPQASLVRFKNGTLIAWLQVYRRGMKNDSPSLLPQGLYIKLDAPGRDPINWKIRECYYNNRLYNSISHLQDAMKLPNFQKAPLNLDSEWTNTEDFSAGEPGRAKPPPLMIQPEGPRYQVDETEKYISWMGFEFFVSTTAATGVSLHDIRFGGDTVIFELAMQEAMAHYAGDDPQQGGLEFLDSTFMMGKDMYELVPGYDCPAYATFLSTDFSLDGSSETNKNSICVFEYTADHLLQRHTAADHVTLSRNTYLVVRSVPTVGNYDYTVDYIFYLDGTMEVKVRASGFIFGAFYAQGREKDDEFGYRVHDALSTSMHDHVINFKADLDIAGTHNTLLHVGIEPLTLDFPWDDEETGPRNTMHLVERPFEIESGFDWPKNAGDMYIVVNENSTNSWGERRGYRIAAGTGMGNPSHLTILNSTTLGVSAEWASRDLWVVKQKDTEPRSSTALNFFAAKDPLVDFSKFVDGEDIIHEDLVVYFNLGSHHVPHSGDIPNTLMHTSASSVMFTPFNFHDRDPSRRSSQGVRVEKKPEGTEARYFGGKNEKGANLKPTDLEPDLTKYHAQSQEIRNWTWVGGLLQF